MVKEHGFEPLVIEKTAFVGGTTAWSGGGLWIPNNPVSRRAGLQDSFESALRYMDEVIGDVGPASSPQRRRAFLEFGPQMVEFLERLGFRWRAAVGYPDYYPEKPGDRPSAVRSRGHSSTGGNSDPGCRVSIGIPAYRACRSTPTKQRSSRSPCVLCRGLRPRLVLPGACSPGACAGVSRSRSVPRWSASSSGCVCSGAYRSGWKARWSSSWSTMVLSSVRWCSIRGGGYACGRVAASCSLLAVSRRTAKCANVITRIRSRLNGRALRRATPAMRSGLLRRLGQHSRSWTMPGGVRPPSCRMDDRSSFSGSAPFLSASSSTPAGNAS
ncbi:MAG: FAD-binding protein [Thermomicrobium sp.]|nr:FAD-binding protein [Thermomicrobium sp.]